MEWSTIIGIFFVIWLLGKILGGSNANIKKNSVPWGSIGIPSDSNPDTIYVVWPSSLDCTCPDWTKRRASFQKNDPRRLCKHLVYAIAEGKMKLPQNLEAHAAIIKTLNELDKGVPRGKLETISITGQSITLYHPHVGSLSEWVNVAEGDSVYAYSPEENRWARDKKPRNALAISAQIMGLPAPLPKEAITTTKRARTPNHTGRLYGTVKNKPILAIINPASKWVELEHAEEHAAYNVGTGEFDVESPRWNILSAAIPHWLSAEYDPMKTSLLQYKQMEYDERKKQRTSP